MTFVAPLKSGVFSVFRSTTTTEMEKPSTCRNLFGPIDHVQLRRDIQALHKAFDDEAEHRWNFNFKAETPHTTRDGQRYQWVRVDTPKKTPRVDEQEKDPKEDTEEEDKELPSLGSVESSTQLGLSLKVSCSTPVSSSAISSESVETPDNRELDVCGLPASAEAADCEEEEEEVDGEDELDCEDSASPEYRGLKRKRVMRQSTIPDFFQMKKNKNCSTPTKRRRLE